MEQVSVRVPATSANLGPGFDCMGLALGLYSTFTARRAKVATVNVTGFGVESLPTGAGNLVYRSAMSLYEALGRRVPTLEIHCLNRVPLNRGLGSSANAIVGGIAAAAALEGMALDAARLLARAIKLEGHPDNVTPALLGGFQVVVMDGEQLVRSSPRVKGGLKAVAFSPAMELATKTARGVLPESLSRADSVFQSGRTALLVAALTQGSWELLGTATQDRLHQPARTKLMPFMPAVFAAARKAGAHAAFLSGAGPTILALASGEWERVGTAMQRAAVEEETPGNYQVLSVATRGAHIVKSSQRRLA